MKSTRKQKNEIQSSGKTLSIHSLKSQTEETVEDWLPAKTLLKPPNQLLLTDKELEEEFIRILNANNPHAPHNIVRFNHKEQMYKVSPNINHLVVHFEFDGFLSYNQEQDEIVEFEKKQFKLPRNQFNFSERSTQTFTNINRSRPTNTEPPPTKIFGFNVNQHEIYDAYIEDLSIKEKFKEKTKQTKSQKDEKLGILPIEQHQEESYFKNAELNKSMNIIERMANLNTFDDIAQDYKYWEDQSDELVKTGTLLPLWKFVCEKLKKKQTTAICWNPSCHDLFAVGFGSYEFSKQGPGMIACFSLKNPSYPEFMFTTDSGVLCLDFHPSRPYLLCVGLYDGSTMVYNLRKKDNPIYKSQEKHRDPCWQVIWQNDDVDENPTFFSISTDGRIRQWTLVKNELVMNDVIQLDSLVDGLLLGGQCFDFHKNNHMFVVGTEQGQILKLSKSYNNQFLLTFEAHQMVVYSVCYNPFHSDYFLSASADWTVKLWDHSKPKALMTFDLYSPVGDICWAPYSSTVFACCTSDGKVFVFDLNENKNEPICEQQVVKKAKLTHIRFNPFEPILIVGDDKGIVVCLKLSPNLRKVVKTEESQQEKLARILSI